MKEYNYILKDIPASKAMARKFDRTAINTGIKGHHYKSNSGLDIVSFHEFIGIDEIYFFSESKYIGVYTPNKEYKYKGELNKLQMETYLKSMPTVK